MSISSESNQMKYKVSMYSQHKVQCVYAIHIQPSNVYQTTLNMVSIPVMFQILFCYLSWYARFSF